MFQIGWYDGNNDGKHIKQHKPKRAKFIDIKMLNDPPKKIQCKHIKKQMHTISMDKAVRDKAVVLFEFIDRNWVKNQPPHEGAILPSEQTDDDSNDDDGGSMIHKYLKKWL